VPRAFWKDAIVEELQLLVEREELEDDHLVERMGDVRGERTAGRSLREKDAARCCLSSFSGSDGCRTRFCQRIHFLVCDVSRGDDGISRIKSSTYLDLSDDISRQDRARV
jgi:hypothetical protein